MGYIWVVYVCSVCMHVCMCMRCMRDVYECGWWWCVCIVCMYVCIVCIVYMNVCVYRGMCMCGGGDGGRGDGGGVEGVVISQTCM